MSLQDGLRNLAAHQDVPAPWNFEMFEQRRARATARRRAALWGSALSVAMLAVVGLIALVTQPRANPDPRLAATPAPKMAPATSANSMAPAEQPALVDMSQFDVTTELEDHIALLDAELSAARIERLPAEQVRRIESTREQMNESLQRVSYAHALLSL
jgi:hypothetical protein